MSKQNTYSLKIGALNCQGLRDKIDYPEVRKLISSCDIFGVTETWFGKNDDPCIKGFNFYPLKTFYGANYQRTTLDFVMMYIFVLYILHPNPLRERKKSTWTTSAV